MPSSQLPPFVGYNALAFPVRTAARMSHNETIDLSDCSTLSTRTLLIDDAAAALGVSRRTVYYRIRDGKLRTVRTRCGSQRVLVSSIEALLRENGVAGGSDPDRC